MIPADKLDATIEEYSEYMKILIVAGVALALIRSGAKAAMKRNMRLKT